MNPQTNLLDSRKVRQITAGGLIAGLTQLIGLGAIVWHWTPEKADAFVKEATNLVTLIAAACGAFVAALTALEDAARKWGIVDPMPHEAPPPVAKDPPT